MYCSITLKGGVGWEWKWREVEREGERPAAAMQASKCPRKKLGEKGMGLGCAPPPPPPPPAGSGSGGGEEISQLKKEEEGEENPFYTSHKNNQKSVIEVVGLDIFVQPDFIGVGSRWEEEEGGGRRGIEIRK